MMPPSRKPDPTRHRRGITAMDIPRSNEQQEADDCYTCRLTESLAKAETRSVSILRIAVISTLLLTGAIVSAGAYLYTRNQELSNFTNNFEDSAHQVMESFHEMVEKHLGAVGSLSTDFTSYAQHANASFPFVTLPDFALRASHFRTLSGSHIIHWLPLVTDEKRVAWEEYANRTRDHIDIEFGVDKEYRMKQDELLGRKSHRVEDGTRTLDESPDTPERPMTIVEDGTGYHSKIWSNGAMAPAGDEPEGSGPFLPTWQRSPITGARQAFLNMNWLQTKVIGPGALAEITSEKKAVLRGAVIPIPEMKENLYAHLSISQYRENVEDYIDGLSTFLAYPVFDKFGDDQQVAGVLATNIYWSILLSHLLPSSSRGIICVVENSFNQTFAYRIDGAEATYLGQGDPHEPKYDDLELSENVNAYLQMRATPQNRAYTTVPISDSTQYTIRVYPSSDTEEQFVTNAPIIYTVVVICGFALASILFLLFSYVVERRQYIMIAKVVENAERVASTERELNEFLAHEVRNPVAAAISASSFVCSALDEDHQLADPETRKCVREDMEVVSSSLNFINDFLRSMLDIHRADGNKITIHKAPADLLRDIFEPVSAILHKRVANFKVLLDCPENLIVETDRVRLKQVILNLVRNSSKFVEKGFVRMRSDVIDREVKIYVEDSGPGIPLASRDELFSKYQLSLDLVSQGTGLGLNLCKKLMTSLGGDLWLDDSYNSGIEGYPGTCFVVQLNSPPIDIEATITVQTDSESDNYCCTRSDSPVKSENSGLTLSNPSQPPNVLFAIPIAPPMTNSPQLPTDHACLQLDEKALSPPSTAVPSPVTASPTPMQPVIPPQLQEGPSIVLPDGIAVLFVDDDAVLRKLFVRAVKRVAPSWDIREASSGEMALQICEENHFTLIFLDQYMASAEKSLLGTETAAQMRSKGIKSIICGLSANDIKDSFLKSGADDFLLKPMPCKADMLRETLRTILQKIEDREQTS